MKVFLYLVLTFGSVGKAGLNSVQVSSEGKLGRPTWFFELPAPNANLVTKDHKKGSVGVALAEIKIAQAKSNFKECWRLSQKILPRVKEIEPWVVLVSLQCATSGVATDKSLLGPLSKEVARVQTHWEWLHQGPYASALRGQVVDSLLILGNADIKDKRKRTWEILDQLFRWLQFMTQEQRGGYYALLGDLTFVEQKWVAALEYYKKSVVQVPSLEIQRKIDKLKSELKKDESAEGTEAVIVIPGPIRSETEAEKIESRMLSAHKSGNLGSVVDDAGEILQKYPDSKTAEMASQKLLEVLNLVLDESDTKLQPLKEKVIDAMESCQPDRIVRWAKHLSGRGQYGLAYRFAAKALRKMDGVINTSEVYELAALTADHSGNPEEAIHLNQKIIEKFPGTTVAREAHFRLGTASYRTKEYAQALKYFETYLSFAVNSENGNGNGNTSSNGNGFKELNSLYWKVRSLEKLGRKDIAEVAAVDLMNRFPISYYGILLRSEKFEGKFQIPFAPESSIKSDFWLIGEHEKGWRRLLSLINFGWLDEALLELRVLPTPTSSELRLAMVKYFTAAMDYPTAIKWVTEAWDANEKYRQKSFLVLTFPRDYISSVEAFAKKNKLDTDLVLSLIRQESAFSAKAISRSGALGLMQLIPLTADEVAKDLSFKSLKIPEEVFNAKLNIQMGTHYLAKMYRKYNGIVPLALASYNAGPTRLDRWLTAKGLAKDFADKKNWTPDDDLWVDELPWSETSYYVKAILRNLIVYRSLKTDQPLNLAFPFWKAVE